jgi:HK97 family phage prohead protease
VKLEVRANQLLIKGYVNITGRDSVELFTTRNGKFKEQIIRKTFTRALRKADNIDLLFNHNKKHKLGSTKNGNLKLYEDDVGLYVECRIFDEKVIKIAKRGALQGWSFAFHCNNDLWENCTDGIQRRYVYDLDLTEVSLLSEKPAYDSTSIIIEGLEKRATPFDSKYFLEKEIDILKLKGGIFK